MKYKDINSETCNNAYSLHKDYKAKQVKDMPDDMKHLFYRLFALRQMATDNYMTRPAVLKEIYDRI